MPRSPALALLLAACAAPDPSPPGRYTPSELVVASSYRLHYESWGSAGTPPLVVPGGSAIGPDLAPIAAQRRLIAYDGRGEGRSDRVEDTGQLGLERDVEDLEELRQHLGLERMSLLGWSYHAAVVTHYAARYPEHVERLILVAPIPLQREPYWRRFKTAIARRLGAERRRALAAGRTGDGEPDCDAVSRLVLPVYFVHPAAAGTMLGTPCAPPNDDPDRVNYQRLAKIERLGDWDWAEVAGSTTAPALVLPGHPDLVHPRSAELWAEALPRGRFVSLGEVGHYPWLEAPAEFFDVVAAFLTAEPLP